MELLEKKKIKNILTNPIILFGIFTCLLTLILLFGCQFELPDLYTDRELANTIADSVNPSDVYEATRHLINNKYFIFNNMFHIWSYSLIIFVFTAVFKITQFQKFKNLSFFTNKWFVYIWINVSYLIWGFSFENCYYIDLGHHVYNSGADTLMIPLVEMLFFIIFVGIIYYIISNLLAIITYNTKLKKRYYNFLWIITLFILFIVAFYSVNMKYSYFHILLDLCYFIWFVFIVYSIYFNKNYEK